MPHVTFTPNLRRHLDAPPLEVAGDTVAAVFAQVFRRQPELRGYLLDDQGRLRRHVAVFVDGRRVRDTDTLGDAVAPASEVCVVQALSGG
ncbi:MAG TPA: MoaD/ThiS family protein [Gammaproteobacteria bacterium]|nr:MoaD/ThiS family protein [Gammaproteobacteria bacterium]